MTSVLYDMDALLVHKVVGVRVISTAGLFGHSFDHSFFHLLSHLISSDEAFRELSMHFSSLTIRPFYTRKYLRPPKSSR